MFENIRLSFRGIWSHKMRSFLTMLGIIIGIASIISIVSTIKGTNEQIKQNLIGSGNNTVRIELQREDYIFDLNQEYVPDLSVVSQQTMDSIKEVDQVVNATKYLQGMADEGVFYKSNSLSGGQVLGIDESYFSTAGLIMKRGHTFSQKDYANRKKVVVLDKNAVDTLFSGINPVGKVVEIKKEPFLVIGVVTELHPFEPVIQTMEDYETFSQESGGKIYVPYSVWPEIFSYDNPEHVLIQVTGTDAMTVAGKETTKILNENFIREDQSLQYKAVDLLEQAKKNTVIKPVNKWDAFVDCGDLTSSWRNWRNEHYASYRDRADKRNWFEKSNWCEKGHNFISVFDGGSSSYKYWRIIRCNIWNRSF